jgi:tRNA pseudouridine38-40 synthase
MTRWRMDLTYDGTGFAGWQVQPGRTTVQGTVEDALRTLDGGPVKVHASGRTDQGVHARLQPIHCDLARDWDVRRLRRGLNALLPPDVRVLRVRRVPASFHARRSVREKEYRYFIWNDDVLPPFLRRYRTHITRRLDVGAMKEAAELLAGRHDFASFTANPNRPVESTIRRVTRVSVVRRGHEVIIAAVGEGFLYRMVRSLAGFLIRVGEGRMTPSDGPRILAARERTAHVETAPPQGLFLWNVRY